jgi:hypothetical protein
LVDLKTGEEKDACRLRDCGPSEAKVSEARPTAAWSMAFFRIKHPGAYLPRIDLLDAAEPDNSPYAQDFPAPKLAFSSAGWKGALEPAVIFFCLLLALAAIFKGVSYYQGLKDVHGRILGAIEGAVTVGRALGETAELKTLADYTLGFGRDRRFLLVFQNNTELRASGGFIGSYAIIDFSKGGIARWEAPDGGSYHTTAGLKEAIKPPAPLWLVSPRWYFWDANWWPDWPKTADKLEWFLEHSDGPTVDGVVGLTPTVVERILAIIGPVYLSEQDLTVDSANFWSEVQTIVEEKPLTASLASTTVATGTPALASSTPPSAAGPKRVIGELMAVLFSELPKRLDREKSVALMAALFRSLDEEQLLLHYNDTAMQAIVRDFGWDGAQRDADGDYLMVVHSNIAGGKTDKVVGERIGLASTVRPDGTVVNRLTIERPHSGEPHKPLTGVRNVDWIRVYVPLGSRLISSTGWVAPEAKWFSSPEPDWQDDPEVAATEGQARESEDGTLSYGENGKTVFANWLMVDPGLTGQVVLEYELPFKFNSGHTLTVEKQPGSLGSDLTAEVNSSEGRIWSVEDKLVTDKHYIIQNANLKMQNDNVK